MSPVRTRAAQLALLAAAVAAPLAVLPANAETPAGEPTGPQRAAAVPGDIVAYPPAFFTEFAPRSALDMVRRVPGFAIDDGDERRGFSGTGGNVLIDGERPSAKSQDLSEILSRIPANQVARIELVRGAQSTEAAGQTQVVNVVRRVDPEAGQSGLYAIELEGSGESGRITARGEASLSGRLGETDYAISFNRYMQERPLAGTRRQTAPDGALLATRTDYTPRTFRETRAAASLTTPVLDGEMNLNIDAGREDFRTVLESRGFTSAGALTDSFSLGLDYRTRDREIGADWERDFGAVTVKAIALDRRSWTADDDATIAFDNAGAFEGGLAQRVRNREQESIVRATVSVTAQPNVTLEAGGEIAFNALDVGLELFEDTSGGRVRVALPNANVRIEEDRGEAFGRGVWSFPDRLTIEGSLAWETSTISQSGDTAASRTLSYWKPSLQVAQGFGEKNQWRIRLWRDVGQLDFDDFASSVDLNDARVAAGNPQLEPDTRWTLEAALDWRWGETGAASLTASIAKVQDLVDRAPIVTPSGVFDARGNIGDADIQRLSFTATIPIDAILPGGLIEAETSLAASNVTDPVTGRERSLSGFSDTSFDIEVRQDLPALSLAWGVEYEGQSEFELFRLSEREVYVEGPFLSAYIETNALPAKIRLSAFNLTDARFRRDRNFFFPTRADAPTTREVRKRAFGPFVALEISGRF